MIAALEQVLAACERSRERDLAALMHLLRQPSISTQGIGMRACADLVESACTAAGLHSRRFETAGQPMIYAERCQAPGKPTVLIYGHYDVQPPDPIDQWLSPPFEPTIRGEKLFARGAGDNKGQFFAQLCGVRAWLETAGELPINVKFLIEGEEETGSPHLDSFVAAHRDLLAADLVYTSDGPVHDREHPQVVYGVRGVIGFEFRARGANHDLHSGNWGGIAPNPAWMLVRLLNTMMDEHNRILIPGFMDDVQPVSPAMRAAMDAIPLDTAAALAGIGVDRLPPPDDVGYFDRLMALPTLNIAGFHSGYGGPGNKTVLPCEAVLKMDTRLVPHQRTEDIIAKVTAHVRRHAPDVEIEVQGTMEPSSTPVDHPYAVAVRHAVERGFRRPPVDVPLLGGSLPDATWTRTLGAPSFLVPYANPDEDNHAPNENIEVERFFNGIRTAASLLHELGNV